MIRVVDLYKISIFLMLSLMSSLAMAQRPEFVLELKDHLFYPANLSIPANTKIKLIIHNRDSSDEEFDSFSLNREKVIFAKQKAVIFIGPLPKGEYHFFGEFHPNSAKGIIIVKDNHNAN